MWKLPTHETHSHAYKHKQIQQTVPHIRRNETKETHQIQKHYLKSTKISS